MLKLQDQVNANVEIEVDGKKIKTAKSAPFTKVYFTHGPNDAVETRKKQFNGVESGTVTVPKDNSTHSTEELYKDMLEYFKVRYPKTDPHQTVLALVTAAYDISERAPVALALKPAKALDENKVFENAAKQFAAIGGMLDPTTGQKVTDVQSIIAIMRAMAGSASVAADA